MIRAIKAPRPLSIFAHLRMPRLFGGLRARVFAWLSLVCVVVTAATFAASYALLHNRAQSEILAPFERVTLGTEASLEYAFARQDEGQVERLLDGLYAERDVTYVQLNLLDGRALLRGETAGIDMHRTFSINRMEGLQEWERIGTLTVGVSAAQVTKSIEASLPNLALISVLIGLAAAVLSAAVIERLVLQHLGALAEQSAKGPDSKTLVKLGRKRRKTNDDLDEIAGAINALKRQIALNDWQDPTEQAAKSETDDFKPVSENRKQAEFGVALTQNLARKMEHLSLLVKNLPKSASPKASSGALRNGAQSMQAEIQAALSFATQLSRPLAPEEFNFDELAREVVRAQAGHIRHTNAKVAMTEIGDLFADHASMELVLRTLLRSALQNQSPDRGLYITIKPGKSPSSQVKIVVVEDSGLALGPDRFDMNVAQLSPFGQPDQDGARVDDLIMCGRIMERSGGQMRVLSEPGKGCRVTILLAGI